MSKLCRWSIVTLLSLFVIRGVFSFSDDLRNELNCPSVTHCECLISTHYEIACPNRINANITMRIEPQQSTNRVEIECNSDDSEIFDNLPDWNIGAAEMVKFNGCPTTVNTTINRVFQRLGIRNVRTLIFFARITPDSPNKPANNALPAKLFGQLPQLEAIWINNCNLTSLPSDLFIESTNLRNISLANNNLISVPASIFHCQSDLFNLDMSFNQLLGLDDGLFSETTGLTVLRLSHNRLSNISR